MAGSQNVFDVPRVEVPRPRTAPNRQTAASDKSTPYGSSGSGPKSGGGTRCRVAAS